MIGVDNLAHSTLKDVAAICGVSVSTASRALNNRGEVSPETRARVLQVAELLGYVPSSLARGLWSGKTRTVGVVVTDITNSFYANVVTGIEDVLDAQGYNILLNSTHEDPSRELRAVRLLVEQRVDGIIIAPVGSEPESIKLLEKNKVPYVVVGRNVRNTETRHVVCDDLAIGRLAAEHLLDAGHERILFINSDLNYSSELREAGFREVLQARGIAYSDDWVLPVRGDQNATIVLKDALDRGLQPTAIFCFCDNMAIDAMRELKRRGLRAPQDIAVMGVDNLEVTELLDPPLTTIDTSKCLMGKESAEMLLAAMQNPQSKSKGVILAPRLIKRVSA